MKFEKIKAGTTLIDEHCCKMGNTKMSRLGAWPVFIVSIDIEKRTAVVRWNHNPAQTYSEKRLKRLRAYLSPAYLRSNRSDRDDDPYSNAEHYPRKVSRV